MTEPTRIIRIEGFEPYIGAEAVERILNKAKPFRDMRVANVNSTYYGGGVAEILSAKTLLMNSLGIQTGWRVIQGSPDFFSVTKKMHNALQGDEIDLTDRKKQIYAAKRIVQLIKDPNLRRSMVERAKESVRTRFLMTDSNERYLDLFASFVTVYKFVKR